MHLQDLQLLTVNIDALSSVIFLIITNTSFSKLCHLFSNKVVLHILMLETSYCNIPLISEFCFISLINMEHLNISKNEITKLSCKSFGKNNSLKLLDISFNNLHQLKRCTFAELQRLEVLFILGNSIRYMHMDTFISLAKLESIESTDFRLCCIAKMSHNTLICEASISWPSSCSELLSNPTVRTLTWIVSPCILLFNLFSIVCCIININRQDKGSFMIFVLGVNASDFFYGIYMLLLAIMDNFFQGRYVAHDIEWRESPLCHLMAALCLFSVIGSCLLLSLLTYSRFRVVIDPIKSNFNKSIKGPVKSVCTCFLFSGYLSILATTHRLFRGSTTQLIQSSPQCTLFGNPIGSTSLLVINISVSTFQLIIVGFIMTLYLLIIKLVHISGKNLQGNSENPKSFSKIFLAVLTNTLALVPSSVVYLLSLGLNKYPTIMITWTIILLNPINPLINPFIFDLASFIHNTFFPNIKARSRTGAKFGQGPIEMLPIVNNNIDPNM